MEFWRAFRELLQGKRISRRGWNGKGQWIELATSAYYIKSDGTCFKATNEAIGSRFILFHGTLGDQVGWLASQGDMLASDWYVVEEE